RQGLLRDCLVRGPARGNPAPTTCRQERDAGKEGGQHAEIMSQLGAGRRKPNLPPSAGGKPNEPRMFRAAR
ncbi:MAG TPA: hypothetical protein VF171_07670, partial [Trueperaceae bacterium]